MGIRIVTPKPLQDIFNELNSEEKMLVNQIMENAKISYTTSRYLTFFAGEISENLSEDNYLDVPKKKLELNAAFDIVLKGKSIKIALFMKGINPDIPSFESVIKERDSRLKLAKLLLIASLMYILEV